MSNNSSVSLSRLFVLGRRSALGLVFMLIQQGIATGQKNSGPDIASISSLLRKARSQYCLLKSFRATVVTRPAFGGTDADETTHVFACQGQKRRVHFWHGQSTWSADPRNLLQIYDGETFNVFFFDSLRYEVANRVVNEGHLSKVRTNFFYEAIGWLPEWFQPDNLQRAELGYLPWVLDDERLRLYESRQLRGTNCAIVGIPTVVNLWIDENNGRILRKEFFTHDEDGRSMMAATYTLQNFQEVLDSVFLPTLVSRKFPTHAAPDAVHTCVYDQVNQVPDLAFQFRPPPGSIVVDRDSDSFHQIPGGKYMMDIFADRAFKAYGRSDHEHSVFASHRFAQLAWLPMTLAMICLVLNQANA